MTVHVYEASSITFALRRMIRDVSC